MKIEYKITLDEVVETQLLWLRDTDIFKQWVIWGMFYWLLAISLVVYFAEGHLPIKLFFGFILGAFIGGPIIFNRKALIRKKLHKFIVKKYGHDNFGMACVSIDDENIVYANEDVTSSYKLNSLKDIEDTEKGILMIFSKKKNHLLTKNRI